MTDDCRAKLENSPIEPITEMTESQPGSLRLMGPLARGLGQLAPYLGAVNRSGGGTYLEMGLFDHSVPVVDQTLPIIPTGLLLLVR